VREEMAVTLRDVLARRWRVELSDWQLTARLAQPVADLMATELGWTDAHCRQQVETYRELLASFAEQAEVGWTRLSGQPTSVADAA